MTRRHRAADVLAAVRSTWMFVGVVVLVLLSVEACYRLQGAGRRAVRAVMSESGAPPHPYSDFEWFPEFTREEEQTTALVWKPYVYFRRRQFEGRYITIDSLGHRRTVQPSATPGDLESVLFFGGSTMWGSPQRDAFTLPSRIAARLNTLPPHQRQVELINFGETGYVFTQSVLELEMQLREGLRPKVVVFYDGINDVFSGVQSGRGGMPQNEQNRALEFELGRVLFNWKHDAGAELRAGTTLATLGFRRLQFFQRLAARSVSPDAQEVSADSIAVLVAAAYVETARLVEALGDDYGFKALYVWQPTFHTTRKVHTPYEARLREELEAQPFQVKLRDVRRHMPALLSPRMHQLVGDRFVDASNVFDADTASVFVDVIGHTTETAVDRIADVIWPTFVRLLAVPRTKTHSGS